MVLYSGGQDSATCLCWALDRFDHVETVGFDYGQRHIVELEVRQAFRSRIGQLNHRWAARLGPDHMLDAGVLKQMGETAMTDDVAIAFNDSGLPNTFVPGRNLLFFTLAGALACRRDISNLVGGMCETDYSGYPDCRDDTLKSQQVTLSLGLDKRMVIHTPLMWIDKAETFQMAERLGGPALLNEIIENSHSCYLGDRNTRHAWGYGCGSCPACELRSAGWSKYSASA
jgi:7-cyano-7-deazaguanine synthase